MTQDWTVTLTLTPCQVLLQLLSATSSRARDAERHHHLHAVDYMNKLSQSLSEEVCVSE